MKRIRTRYLYLAEVMLIIATFIFAHYECRGWGQATLLSAFIISIVTGYRKEQKRIKDGYYKGYTPWLPWRT